MKNFKSFPVSEKDLASVISLLNWEEFKSPREIAKLREMAKNFSVRVGHLDRDMAAQYVFLPLQNLCAPLKALGYDFRYSLCDMNSAVPNQINRALKAAAMEPEPPIAGDFLIIEGRAGLVFSKTWLKSAGIDKAKLNMSDQNLER